MKITPRIEHLIQSGGSVSEFEKTAREDGMVTMLEDGLQKVREGLTTQEEVRRVAPAN
jgi:type II secretory ATPase GspE/PulE/Tfp pilus assembly ATPase PilB-like protein